MLKILVLKNDRLDTKSSFIKAKIFFASKGIEVSFFQKEVNELVSLSSKLTRQGFDKKTGKPTTINLMGLDGLVVKNILKHKTEEYDGVIFAYDSDKIEQTLMSNESFCSFTYLSHIELVVNQYALDKDELWKTITHEMMHFFCYNLKDKGIAITDLMDTFIKNNDPYAPDGNYAMTFNSIKDNIDDLYKPKTMINKITTTVKNIIKPLVKYKYFSDREVARWQLKPELWSILDKMRGECGFPFIINSGLRTKEENDKLKDSASDSAHLSGLAVDIRVANSSQRFKIIEVALKNKINRIGIGKEFVHIDVDKTKPQSVMWHYY